MNWIFALAISRKNQRTEKAFLNALMQTGLKNKSGGGLVSLRPSKPAWTWQVATYAEIGAFVNGTKRGN